MAPDRQVLLPHMVLLLCKCDCVMLLYIVVVYCYSGVYLCGHSAGAHLAALMLSQNWLQETMVSHSIIKGAFIDNEILVRNLVNPYPARTCHHYRARPACLTRFCTVWDLVNPYPAGPKVISLCHQCRARSACTSVESDQALYCLELG